MKGWFIVLVFVCVGLFGYHYVSTTSHFENSCERICTRHTELCAQLPVLTKALHKDSVVVLNVESMALLQAHNEELKSMLELQHQEISEDYSNLMLWASVLMIIFLVFSMYSMYRVDDLVQQRRESVARVHEHSDNAKRRIGEVDKLFETESEKLGELSKSEISKLQDESTKALGELKINISRQIDDSKKAIAEQIVEYNTAIAGKAENVEKQLDKMGATMENITMVMALFKAAAAVLNEKSATAEPDTGKESADDVSSSEK